MRLTLPSERTLLPSGTKAGCQVESCKANNVNLLTYLTYELGNARNKSITPPTPDEFKASNISHVSWCAR